MSNTILDERKASLGALDVPSELKARFEAFEAALLAEGPLPPSIIDFGLALAFSNKGQDALARAHGSRAVELGLTRPQVVEGLLAGVLSRGVGVLASNLWMAQEAAAGPWADLGDEVDAATSEILESLSATFGSVPPWLRFLADSSSETLEAYYGLRSKILRDGALPRKHKELLLVMINSSERYRLGLEIHMKGAVAGGANRDEVLQAVRATMTSGGMVAWLEAAEVVDEVFGGGNE